MHRLGEMISQSEFQVYVKDDTHDGGKRPVKKNESGWDLIKLLEEPNHQDSFGDLLAKINQQMDLTGTSLTWMLPNRLGTPMELYEIPTAIAIPQPTINPEFPQGFYRIQPLYPYGPFSSYPTPSTAVGAPVPAQWVLKIKYPHPLLHYDGYSPLTAMRLHLDEIEQMDRSRWYNMKRGISPSAVLQFTAENAHPLPEEEIERIRTEMENTFQGPENHGQFYVATPGAQLEPWGNKPIEMDYQSGWDQLVSFVLGAGFGITKPAAGMIEDASYSTLFATLKQLHLLTLGPKVNRIAAKFTRQLAKFFGDDLIVEIKCQKIDDHEVLNSKLASLAGNMAITNNELRAALGWPIVKEEWGKERVGTPPQQPGMPGGEGGDAMAGLLGGMLGGTSNGGGGKVGEMEEIPGPQGQIPGVGGVGGGEGLGPPNELKEEEGKGPPLPPALGGGSNEEAPSIRNSRPRTRTLGRGALGERTKKSLSSVTPRISSSWRKKSLYDSIRKVISNGKR